MVMKLIPLEDQLIVEASAQEMLLHVRTGMPAQFKLTAYDYANMVLNVKVTLLKSIDTA